MTEVGLNFPSDLRLAPQFGGLLRAQWLRVVLQPEYDLTPWIKDAHRQGLKVLGVIARESLAGTYEATAELYRHRYGSLDALQCGNESDHESPSSWTMTAADLNNLLLAFNVYFATDTTIVGPGLVSGDPAYLNGVDLDLVDAIAIHPYGRTPDTDPKWSQTPGNFGTVAQLLDAYRYHSKPMWVTEVGLSTTEVSEAFQADYCEAMLKHLKLRADVPVAMWFCADDLMGSEDDEFGLYHADHSPKPAAPAFMRAAAATEPEPEKPMSDDQAMDAALKDLWTASSRDIAVEQYDPEHMSIVRYWKTHVGEMGTPVGGEYHADSGNAYCAFSRGVWRWLADGSDTVEKVA